MNSMMCRNLFSTSFCKPMSFPSLSFLFAIKRLSGSESSLLTRQKELLLQKLETFEATNRTLRHLLREQHGSQVLCVTHLPTSANTPEESYFVMC